MASTTYRVIQDSHQIGTLTREQVDQAIRVVMEKLAKKPGSIKRGASSSKAARAAGKK